VAALFDEINSAVYENPPDLLPLSAADASVRVVKRPWGEDRWQYLFVSPTPRLLLRPIAGLAEVGDLTFDQHPLGEWPFERFRATYANGLPDVEFHVADFGLASQRLSLTNLQSVDVTMGEAAHSQPFGGYVFVVHYPRTRILRALPDSTAEPFRLCRS
jgi:hypothetical protein